MQIMDNIPDNHIDLVLADPPYGTTACRWDTPLNMRALWKHLKRVTKPSGAILLMAQTPFDKALGYSNLRMLRYEWIWIKEQGTGNLNANKMPLKKHENILVFYQKLPTYNPQFSEGKPYRIKRGYNNNKIYGKTGTRAGYITNNSGKRYPTTILHYSRDLRPRHHPTQKPVALMTYLIKTYTNKNDTVLDFVMGSGSTGVACAITKRNFIGIELVKKYFDISVKRIKTGGQAMRE